MRCAALLALAACSVGPPGPSLDVDRELAHIAALVTIGPRPVDSAAARDAASYIRTALAPIALETTPVGDVDLPAIEVLGTTFREAQRVHVDDPDLVARFGPSPNRSTARPRPEEAPLRTGEAGPTDGPSPNRSTARLRPEEAPLGTGEAGPTDGPSPNRSTARPRPEDAPLRTGEARPTDGPTGKALLFMAHYDTVPGAPGAIDDGASVAVLIELARELHAHPPAQPVMIAFTADEEGGLVGAEALAARHGDEVELAIALDMIGGSGPLILNGASKRIGLVEMTWLARAADRAGVRITAPLPHRVVSRWWPQAERADHGVFTRRGIRAFHLYNRGQDGLWIDTAYHSPRDVFDRVDRASLDEMSRLARELVAVPPPAPHGDGFWVPLATNVVVPRWCLLAGDLALALVGLLGLGALAVSGRAAGRERGAGIWLALLCFAVAGTAAAFANHPIDLDPTRISLANIAREIAGTSLIVLGVIGLTTRLIARRLPWIGAGRYLGLAIVPLLVVGLALFAVGAAELAWIWLAPAALLAIAPRLPRFLAALAVLFALLPAALVLQPNQVLEAAWNGFFPPGVPLAIWIAALVGPALAAIAWWWRSRPTRGPLGTLVLPVGCGVSVMVGLLLEFSR